MFTGKIIWKKQPCKIIDDKIELIKTAPAQEYNLFDYMSHRESGPLYDIFARLDENDTEKIKDFCSKFGLLGLNNSSEDRETRESIEDIKEEILRMRAILKTLNGITDKDSNAIMTNWEKAVKNPVTVNDNRMSDDLFQIAQLITASIINEYLTKITLILDFDYDTNKYVSGWRVNSLLSAMYLFLYLELSEGKLIKSCQNERCGRFFTIEPTKINNKYCAQSCAIAQASREYRRRKAKGKEKMTS